jgi:hypothetical protein
MSSRRREVKELNLSEGRVQSVTTTKGEMTSDYFVFGYRSAPFGCGDRIMTRTLKTVLLLVAFLAPLILTPSALRADDRRYHDAEHNDDHNWNSHENRAYRMWVKENHRRYRNFETLKEEERQSYWGWRHEHDDARLKIVIR